MKLVALVLAALAGVPAARVVLAADARLAHSEDATVVLTYAETLGEIGEADAGPSLRIHGDGRIDVHYPPYMKRAGDYAARLERAELDALLGSLADKGVLDFDAETAHRGKRQADLSRRQVAAQEGRPATFNVVSDASTSTIEIHLQGVEKKIVWHGLREDAREYPELPAIRHLAAAEQEIRAVMERHDLAKTR